MRIVDVTEFYSERGGGVRSHLTVKSQILCQWGHDQLVLAPGPRSELRDHLSFEAPASIDRPGSAKIRRFRGPSVPYDPTYHLLFQVPAVARAIREAKPDVLEIHSPYLGALAANIVPRSSFGVRTFVWHSDFIDTYLRERLREVKVSDGAADRLLAPFWAGVRALLSRCDATIVATEWLRAKLTEHGVPRVRVVPFGVDKELFRPELRDEELRARYLGGRRDRRLLIATGRFAGEKRWDVVFAMFDRIALQADVELLILGDGPEGVWIQKEAKKRPNVQLLGFEKDRKKLATLLASGDLFLHAAPFETFGFGLAEAMCAGLPVVTPKAGAAAEFDLPGTVVHYPVLDGDAASRAALALLAEDPETLRAQAIENRERISSVEDHYRNLLALYEELLAKQSRERR
jgi:alpha-1,6-mannosyltransferase